MARLGRNSDAQHFTAKVIRVSPCEANLSRLYERNVMPKLTLAELMPDAPPGRFNGIERSYAPADVIQLSGSFPVQHSLAERGANRLWRLLQSQAYVPALGAMTGNQAVQMVRAGLNAIYLSGWQVAADSHTAGAAHSHPHRPPPQSGPPPR